MSIHSKGLISNKDILQTKNLSINDSKFAAGFGCSHCSTDILLTMVIISYLIVYTITGGKYLDIDFSFDIYICRMDGIITEIVTEITSRPDPAQPLSVTEEMS